MPDENASEKISLDPLRDWRVALAYLAFSSLMLVLLIARVPPSPTVLADNLITVLIRAGLVAGLVWWVLTDRDLCSQERVFFLVLAASLGVGLLAGRAIGGAAITPVAAFEIKLPLELLGVIAGVSMLVRSLQSRADEESVKPGTNRLEE